MWRVVGADEQGTLERPKAIRAAPIEPQVAADNGRSSRPPAAASS
jgi:hypothetical protein